MLDAFIEQYATATITRTQTTFLDLAVTTGTFRVHYRDKAEFLVRNGANGALAHFTEHPLLWDYNGPWNTLYVSGAAPDPPALARALHKAVASASHQWRALDRYLNGQNRASSLALLDQNLADGSGLLVEGAPVVIAQAVADVCRQHGAATYSLAPPSSTPVLVPEPFSLLFIGTCTSLPETLRRKNSKPALFS